MHLNMYSNKLSSKHKNKNKKIYNFRSHNSKFKIRLKSFKSSWMQARSRYRESDTFLCVAVVWRILTQSQLVINKMILFGNLVLFL